MQSKAPTTPASEVPNHLKTRELRWFAMGSEVHLVVRAAPALVDGLARHAQARLADLESQWTRFRPTSEISRLNAANGAPMRCSTDTVRLVELLVQAWWVTDGAFDPTLLGSLVGLGYHASRSAPEERTDLMPGTESFGGSGRGRPDAVLVDPIDGIVQLPSGTFLDPGGLGKGFAADIVVAELTERGAAGALASVGGDIAVSGSPDGDAAWSIEVEPDPGCEPSIVCLRSGGVATSSSRLRTWSVGGIDRHHILDPVTGQPTDPEVAGTAVIAGSAATAEAFTKCAFVNGVARAIDTFERFGLAARIWHHASDRVALTQTSTGAWADFAVGPAQITIGEL